MAGRREETERMLIIAKRKLGIKSRTNSTQNNLDNKYMLSHKTEPHCMHALHTVDRGASNHVVIPLNKPTW